MEFLRSLWARLTTWMGRRTADRDLDEELRAHLVLALEEEQRRGASPTEARRLALARFGGLDASREQHRDARGLPVLETVGRDVRDALRLLRRSPGFAAVAIVSLALGIGANAAIFSIFNTLVVRPLPIAEPSRLVRVMPRPDQSAGSYPLWEQIRSQSTVFAGTAAWSSFSLNRTNLVEGNTLLPVRIHWVSGDFFTLLGVRAQRGRTLTLDDEHDSLNGSDRAAVVSDAFWRQHLGGSDDAIGRTLTLDRFPVTVVGVMPATFTGPEVGDAFDLVLPITALPHSQLDGRTFWWVTVFARLQPGQSIDAASSAIRGLQPRLRAATLPVGQRPDLRAAYLTAPMSVVSAETGHSDLRARYRDPLAVLMVGVALLLVIACANLTNLLLARAEGRRHEISLRLALGASRIGLIRQALIESLLLSSIGAVAGLVLAMWMSRILVQRLSTDVNHVTLALSLDWRVLAFTSTIAMSTAVIVGLAPALRATRVAPQAVLAERSRGIAGAGHGRLGSALVVVQIALSLLLVTAAGLLGRTFLSLAHADLGFNPDPVAIVNLTLRPGAAQPDTLSWASRLERAIVAVKAAPGVATAAFGAQITPMVGMQEDDILENPTGVSLPERDRDVYFSDAGHGWFEAMGVRVVAGRDFADEDRAQPDGVIIVNEALARRFFPGQNPVGQTLREQSRAGQTPRVRTIVGVVGDIVYMNARQGVPPTLYRPLAETPSLIVRAGGGHASAIVRDVEAAITRADPDLLVTTRLLADQAAATLVRERLVATLSSVFGIIALVLAGTGVYGVMAYTVGRRRSEIGIRRTLGATTASIVGLVLRRSLGMTLLGTLIGSGVSVWALRFVEPLLFGLTPQDGFTLAGASVMLGLVSGVASWVPVRRATRVDPGVVLREY